MSLVNRTHTVVADSVRSRAHPLMYQQPCCKYNVSNCRYSYTVGDWHWQSLLQVNSDNKLSVATGDLSRCQTPTNQVYRTPTQRIIDSVAQLCFAHHNRPTGSVLSRHGTSRRQMWVWSQASQSRIGKYCDHISIGSVGIGSDNDWQNPPWSLGVYGRTSGSDTWVGFKGREEKEQDKEDGGGFPQRRNRPFQTAVFSLRQQRAATLDHLTMNIRTVIKQTQETLRIASIVIRGRVYWPIVWYPWNLVFDPKKSFELCQKTKVKTAGDRKRW